MASLAQTLTLLAMAVVITADEVKHLDMAPDSFDDQYRGCGPAMKAALPALNCTEFHLNHLFAQIWAKAAANWWSRGSPMTWLTPDQATAIMAFTMDDLDRIFNDAVHVAGRSTQQYRDNFHFKTLHFLLIDAIATLRGSLPWDCYDMFQQVCGVRFEAQRGDTIRFGQFMGMLVRKPTAECSGKETVFHVHTCQGVDISFFSVHPSKDWALIPPFETFEVTEVTRVGDKAEIHLRSTGTFSKYNCELLQGGSVPRSIFHLRGLLLATTALVVATGIL
nr:erythroblast NAD(P)(+)--arginine ADP-ribosyltransferase-like [Zonotrichia albicollis]